jgi:signal transduction histidine kinase
VELFVNALRTKLPYEVEHRMRRADGSYRWVLARAQPLFDVVGEVSHWFGTSTDIHERKAAENLLLRTEKLAAAGRLAATVAHEINNPLEAVGNLIYLALHESGLPSVPRGYLRMANDELRRIGHIVSQTLGFYRDAGTPQPIDLAALVNDVLSLYQRKLDARQIRVTRSMESAIVEGVAGELRQVVANLLSNALDAMEPYGVLAIEVRSQRDQVRLSVSDTGHGIATPILEHIFEPFFTTKKDVGTGLGLWVSKGIVEKHQGRLDVMSSQDEEDHGTAFVMTLPRREEMRKSA